MDTSPDPRSTLRSPQHARQQGLARISAVTLGLGAAGVLGAVAIAVSLPGSATASAHSATTSTTTTTTTPPASSDDDSGTSQQLQTTPAPAPAVVPPVASSGGS